MKQNAKQSRKAKPSPKADDFLTVARRLECDEDKERFEKKLGKIAKAATPEPKPKK